MSDEITIQFTRFSAFYSKIVAPDVFQHAGLITKRHRYEDVVAAPPEA